MADASDDFHPLPHFRVHPAVHHCHARGARCLPSIG
nr:MAG TPA: hypothetical protein [Inoviridae sp.]